MSFTLAVSRLAFWDEAQRVEGRGGAGGDSVWRKLVEHPPTKTIRVIKTWGSSYRSRVHRRSAPQLLDVPLNCGGAVAVFG